MAEKELLFFKGFDGEVKRVYLSYEPMTIRNPEDVKKRSRYRQDHFRPGLETETSTMRKKELRIKKYKNVDDWK